MKYWFKGEAKIKDTKLEMVDAMFANGKLTDEDISSISGVPLDEIQKRRAQRKTVHLKMSTVIKPWIFI